jgi:hypothetical protein
MDELVTALRAVSVQRTGKYEKLPSRACNQRQFEWSRRRNLVFLVELNRLQRLKLHKA